MELSNYVTHAVIVNILVNSPSVKEGWRNLKRSSSSNLRYNVKENVSGIKKWSRDIAFRLHRWHPCPLLLLCITTPYRLSHPLWHPRAGNRARLCRSRKSYQRERWSNGVAKKWTQRKHRRERSILIEMKWHPPSRKPMRIAQLSSVLNPLGKRYVVLTYYISGLCFSKFPQISTKC